MNHVTKALEFLVSRIPASSEPVHDAPQQRARAIARVAALKAAGVSGALTLPSGPLALATVVPDLLAIWRLQQAMVADIAAAFGKSAALRKEAMVYCLFKHGAAALVRDLVVRSGERYVIRHAAFSVLQDVLQRIGVRVTEKTLGRTISRVVPVVGAVSVGAYAYYDTSQVAKTAIELFSSELTPDALEQNASAPVALVGEARSDEQKP